MSAPDTIYEKQLIASVLMAPADTFALDEVSAVKPEHFHDLELRRVFQTAQQAHTEGGYVSPASIAARLSDEGPTLAELGVIATAFTSSLDTPALAERVRKDGEARRAKAALHKAYKLVDQGGDPADIMMRLAKIAPERKRDEPEIWTAEALGQLVLPESPWLLPGLILEGGLNLLAGEVASGKSWLLLDFCLAAAVGGIAWGQRFDRPRRVLYIGPDNKWGTVASRLRALQGGRNVAGPASLLLYDQAINLSEPAGILALSDIIKANAVDVVALDVLSNFAAGVDENSAGEVSAVMVGLRSIANDVGTSILIAHHLNKSKGVGAVLERIRGSIAIPAGVDTAFLLTVDGDGLEARRTLRQKKNREAQEAPAMVFTIQQSGDGLTLAFDQASGQTASKVREAVLLALEVTGPMSTNSLRRHVGGRGGNVTAAIRDLLRTGEIAEEPGTHRSKIYSLKSPSNAF